MKPFLSNCAFCGEPVIRDGTGCHCDCHDKSFKKYLKDKVKRLGMKVKQ